MCRDPGDATSKVSCCVETSYCFKNRDFDAIVKSARSYASTQRFDGCILKKKAQIAFWWEFHFKPCWIIFFFYLGVGEDNIGRVETA